MKIEGESTPHHIRATHPKEGVAYACAPSGGIGVVGVVGVVDDPDHVSRYKSKAEAELGLRYLQNSIDRAPGFLEGWTFEIVEGKP